MLIVDHVRGADLKECHATQNEYNQKRSVFYLQTNRWDTRYTNCENHQRQVSQVQSNVFVFTKNYCKMQTRDKYLQFGLITTLILNVFFCIYRVVSTSSSRQALPLQGFLGFLFKFFSWTLLRRRVKLSLIDSNMQRSTSRFARNAPIPQFAARS